MSDSDVLNSWFEAMEKAGLKHRPGQRDMAEKLASSIENSGISVAEGGTGIGKSFAALLAALSVRKKMEAHEEKQTPILYSTGTIALQDQLINKDLPALNSMLDLDFTFGLVKGQGRYMCPRKAQSALGDTKTMELFGDQDDMEDIPLKDVGSDVSKRVSKLDRQFRTGKWDGDLDALEDTLSDEVKEAVTVAHGACLKKKCSEYNRCPFYKARKALKGKDVIVTNHALLLCDLALGGGRVLPCSPKKTDYLIDEAHQFPDTAVKHLGGKLYFAGFQSWLDSFRKNLNRHFASPIPLPEDIAEQLQAATSDSRDATKAAVELIPVLDANHGMFNDSHAWIFAEGCPDSIKEPLSRLHRALDAMSGCLESVAEKIKDRTELEKLAIDVGFFTGKTNAALDAVSLTLLDDVDGQPPVARWLENLPEGYVLNAYPTFASHRLAEIFWKEARSISCFSATLRSVGSFKRFLTESGLDITPRRVNAFTVDSGFDYNQSGLYLLRDGPDPKNKPDHQALMISSIARAILNVQGGILVLFTSRAMLKDVYEGLYASDDSLDTTILRQGTMSRDKIIKEHTKRIRKGEKSCIFGLASFGEGVDLPGDLCASVIIARIPFPVPTTPMEIARVEWIKKCGGNPFWDYSLPVSSIRLTQMVGRLVRTESDKGNVVIMDNRIARLRYGNLLLSNLPPMPVKTVSAQAFADG